MLQMYNMTKCIIVSVHSLQLIGIYDMESILLKANAKINWTLKVVGKREDGYHELDMLLSSVTLFDRVRITRVPFKGIRVQTYGRFVLNGERNIAYKAAACFYDELNEREACRIDIQKHIPVCAGMGGGSADAAAVLYGLNELYGRPFSGRKLAEIGAGIGADVPFMLAGGLGRVTGIGEKVERLICPQHYNLIGVMPRTGASTRTVFSRFNMAECRSFPDNDAVYKAIMAGDIKELAGRMGNSLEYVTASLCPEIVRIKEELLRNKAVGAMMTGSGALVYGVYEDAETASAAADAVSKLKLGRVYRFDTCDKGIDVIYRR